ncbi:MAG: lipid A biosynthesis acyltransferase, partial [Candidatus Parcubacteria bacterium]|nr:lipid A biosynthesis acyltransferase [Burkholderiales bacterium]
MTFVASRAIFFFMWLLHFLPLAVIAAIGNAVGSALFWLIPERRKVTRINLHKCFPDMRPADRERLARAHFRAFCRSFIERGLLWWASRARIERLIRVEGLEHLRAVMETPGGSPVILFAPHFVGLDAGGARLACEVDGVSMYANQKDAKFNELLLRGRSRFGNQRLVSRQQGIRATIAAMRAGHPFYYLPDQDYGPRDTLFVPFFGVPAATVPGLGRLAKVAGAKVLPCVTRLLPEGYVL